jgi:hypothetical protein
MVTVRRTDSSGGWRQRLKMTCARTDHEGIDDYKWPEQQLAGWGAGTNNVGVSISGGGSRAYTAGFGQLRGLFNAGVLGKTRYMAGISGGSWVIANYVYTQTTSNDRTFLSVDDANPATLNMGRLNGEYSTASLGFGATQDLLLDLVSNVMSSKLAFFNKNEPGEAWGNSVGKAILAPYGLDNDKFFTWNAALRDNIAKRNRELSRDDFIIPASERNPSLTKRPYMILGITGTGPVEDKAFENMNSPPLLDPKKKSFVNIQVCVCVCVCVCC